MNRKASFFLGLTCAAMMAAFAQGGGYPVRPTFQSVGVGVAPPAGVGNVRAAGDIQAATFNGSPLPSPSSGANPTGTVGLTAVNGVATTFLRSDGAPLLSQAITPTWTGAHTFTNLAAMTIASANPQDRYSETDVATNNQAWKFDVSAGVLSLRLCDDTFATCTNAALTIARSGVSLGAFNLFGSAVSVNNEPVATRVAAAFTGTLATGCTTTPTGTFRYARTGQSVTVTLAAALTCTSNSTAMTVTGLPGTAQSALTLQYLPCSLVDNGNTILGICQIQAASGTMTFAAVKTSLVTGFNNIDFAGFTGSGTKGIPSGLSFTYGTQ